MPKESDLCPWKATRLFVGLWNVRSASCPRKATHLIVGLWNVRSTSCPRAATHLIVGLWNVRSAVNQALGVNDLIVESDLDALYLTETWLMEAGDDVSIGEMTPPDFSFLYRPRLSGRGGGVAIMFREHVKVGLCKYRSFSSLENIEVCVTRGKQTIRLVCVYRPPPSARNSNHR